MGQPMGQAVPPFSARERSASIESLPSDSMHMQGPPWSARSQGGQQTAEPGPAQPPPWPARGQGGQTVADRMALQQGQGKEQAMPSSMPNGSAGFGSAGGGGSASTSATDPGKALHAAEELGGSSSEMPVGSSTETEAPWAFRRDGPVKQPPLSGAAARLAGAGFQVSQQEEAPRQDQQGPHLQWLKTPPRSVPQLLEQSGPARAGGDGPARTGEMRGREYPRNSDTARPEFGVSQPMSPHSSPANGPTPRGEARSAAGDGREVRGIYGELQAYPSYAEPGPMQTPQISPHISPRQQQEGALESGDGLGSSVSMDMEHPPPHVDELGRSVGVFRGDQSKTQSPRTKPRTPPRSSRRRGPTPPPQPQAASSSAEADGDDAGRARNPNRGITAARAGAMWRQQTLTEHDAERRTLQERVEQMRRQIDAERAAAPRRQYANLP